MACPKIEGNGYEEDGDTENGSEVMATQVADEVLTDNSKRKRPKIEGPTVSYIFKFP